MVNNEVRIIGGRWRSRKLRFPDAPGLRPTPGRVRETLFNWLRNDLDGARCLDLYAGSGALGFEAASRGAGRVVMVESAPAVAAALLHNRDLLTAAAVEVVRADAARYLAGPVERFDLVFLDPPFQRNCLVPACRALDEGAWLAPSAQVYLEAEPDALLAGLPPSWHLHRSGKAGDVAYFLYQCRT